MNSLDEILRLMLIKARRKLAAATRALEAGDWDDAASRAYYAAFHAASTVLRARGLSYSSHGQTVGAFNREFIAPGHFPAEFTRILARLFEDRQLGDYEIIHTVDGDTATRDVADATRFVDACADYLEKSR